MATDIEDHGRLFTLFGASLHEMGIDAEHCTDENWRDVSNSLLGKLEKWLLMASGKAQSNLKKDLSARLHCVPYRWDKQSIYVGGITVRPPNDFYWRKDQVWDLTPTVGQGGELFIQVELQGARHSSLPDHYLSPVLHLSLHVGYRACEPMKWLIDNWRRPLEKMLLPLKSELDVNGDRSKDVDAFRGKDVVRKAELYLANPDKTDPVISWHLRFSDPNSEDDAIQALGVFMAIYDAVYSLRVQRCDPDRLYQHFLTLESDLPNLPFRGGFYDPGVTRLQMIKDWNRRNPDKPIPLDAKI